MLGHKRWEGGVQKKEEFRYSILIVFVLYASSRTHVDPHLNRNQVSQAVLRSWPTRCHLGSDWLLSSARAGFVKPSTGLRRRHVVRQQHFNSEADSFSLEDAVGVVESQNICAKPTWHQHQQSALGPDGRRRRSLTDSRLFAGQRPILGHQVSVVPLVGHHLLHLGGLLPFPLSPLQKHPEADVGALCGELPPARRRRRSMIQASGNRLPPSEPVPPDWPENAAREQDLVVQLLGGAAFDHGALLVVHANVVPHVVRGGNRTHVVDLQPTAGRNKFRMKERKKEKIW